MPDASHTYSLSIVVPVYNGAATVGTLVEALAEIEIPGGHEVLLVYDGSPEDSLAVCRRLQAEGRLPITVVHTSRNYGEHQHAINGPRHTRGDHILTVSDELQHPAKEV